MELNWILYLTDGVIIFQEFFFNSVGFGFRSTGEISRYKLFVGLQALDMDVWLSWAQYPLE